MLFPDTIQALVYIKFYRGKLKFKIVFMLSTKSTNCKVL